MAFGCFDIFILLMESYNDTQVIAISWRRLLGNRPAASGIDHPHSRLWRPTRQAASIGQNCRREPFNATRLTIVPPYLHKEMESLDLSK